MDKNKNRFEEKICGENVPIVKNLFKTNSIFVSINVIYELMLIQLAILSSHSHYLPSNDKIIDDFPHRLHWILVLSTQNKPHCQKVHPQHYGCYSAKGGSWRGLGVGEGGCSRHKMGTSKNRPTNHSPLWAKFNLHLFHDFKWGPVMALTNSYQSRKISLN